MIALMILVIPMPTLMARCTVILAVLTTRFALSAVNMPIAIALLPILSLGSAEGQMFRAMKKSELNAPLAGIVLSIPICTGKSRQKVI